MAKDRTKKKTVFPRRLLLLSCSQRKRRTRSLLPAINRYDGPAFRVLRRYLSEEPTAQPDVLILSAKWGLITGDTLLADYDQQITERRARQLRPLVTEGLREILEARSYKEMFVAMSKSYFQALADKELSNIAGLTIYFPQGRNGQKTSALYDWLHGSPPPRKIPNNSLRNKHKKPRLRGIEISCTKQKALKLASQALRQNEKTAMRTYSWYVQLGKKRISPKWLVSLLTGLSVSAFVTDEARRVLAQLGIEVRHASDWKKRT